jgi:hypothetical protein
MKSLPSHVTTISSKRLGHGVMSLSNHAGDGAAEATSIVAQYRCRVMLMMPLPMRLDRDMM